VREVSFTRKHKRRPDAILTVYYDSLDGLRARGVPVDPPPYYRPTPNPQPWPATTGGTTNTRRRPRCAATEILPGPPVRTPHPQGAAFFTL
jgi:hypothetical protein